MGKVKHIPSQNQRVIEYINKFGSITHREAEKYLGICRLASRIADLRRLGYPVTSEFIQVTNRYGEKSRIKRYSFIEEGETNEK